MMNVHTHTHTRTHNATDPSPPSPVRPRRQTARTHTHTHTQLAVGRDGHVGRLPLAARLSDSSWLLRLSPAATGGWPPHARRLPHGGGRHHSMAAGALASCWPHALPPLPCLLSHPFLASPALQILLSVSSAGTRPPCGNLLSIPFFFPHGTPHLQGGGQVSARPPASSRLSGPNRSAGSFLLGLPSRQTLTGSKERQGVSEIFSPWPPALFSSLSVPPYVCTVNVEKARQVSSLVPIAGAGGRQPDALFVS